MTRIPGWPSGPAPQALTPGIGAATALLAELPQGLRSLASGAFLSGTVLERNSSGLILLQTGAGILGLKTTVPLPAGSTVTLQVQSAGAQLQVLVLSVTPQAASGGSTPPLPPPATPPAPAPNAAAATGDLDGRAGQPSTVTATVIGPPGGPLPAAARQAATLPSPSAPGPPTAGAPAPAIATAASGAMPAVTGPAPQAAAPAAAAPTPATIASPPPASGAPAPILTGPLPPAATAPVSTAPAAPPAPAAESAARRVAPSASEPAAAPLPTGSKVQVRLVTTAAAPAPAPAAAASAAPRATPGLAPPTVRPPASASSNAPAAPPAPQVVAVAATVVARTPTGQTVVDTAIGRLLVGASRTIDALPVGARLDLEMLLPERPAAAGPSAAPSGGPGRLARDWPALKDVIRTLLDSPDEAARAAVERALPRPGPRLGQQVLAFIAGANAGGVKDWLGEAALRTLERLAGPALPARLDDELAEMRAHRASDGQWHMTVVPVLDGRDIRQVRFFERRKKNDDGAKGRDKARFVVECEHSAFGALQLDGLMHDRRLDLILRSHDPLPAAVESDILGLFNLACAGLGLGGQLAFQAMAAFPVNPLDEFTLRGMQVSV